MKSIFKVILWITGALTVLLLIWLVFFFYITEFQKKTCDTSVSPDGQYEVTLLAIGEPGWPFGPASGRVVFKRDGKKISQANFELQNDGVAISDWNWSVAWNEDYAKVNLHGSEQEDEQVTLYFDGSIEKSTETNERN